MAQNPDLPQGWSQHLAPSGHYYYYNASTQQSTYQIPKVEAQPLPPPSAPLGLPEKPIGLPDKPDVKPAHTSTGPKASETHGNSNKRQKKNNRRPDRPKIKLNLEVEPWVLVFLRSGRRFVHNTETKQSLWKGPDNIQAAVDKVDTDELLTLIAKARGLKLKDEIKEKEEKEEKEAQKKIEAQQPEKQKVVIVDEAEDDEYYEDEEDLEPEEQEGGDVSSPGEDMDWLNEDIPSEDEAGEEVKLAGFRELLDSYDVNPYNEWDVELFKVVDDDRYSLLETTKDRKKEFDLWARDKIAAKKEEPKSNVPTDVSPSEIILSCANIYRLRCNSYSLSRKISNQSITLSTSKESIAKLLNLKSHG